MFWFGQRPLGMGCMRLSTAPERDDQRGVSVIHAALDAGVRLLDTADAYAHDDRDLGHNERLIAKALTSWSGNAADVLVATKGGLTRPGGRWVPNGSAKHLRTACEASLKALAVSRLALYQLHAPDPRISFDTSVNALAELQRAGLIERIGLCNVDRTQIERALDLADIASVQVSMSPFDDEALYGGVVELCVERGILLIAHTPLGGSKKVGKLGSRKGLTQVAARHAVSASQAALAWLRDLAAVVVPIPGAGSVESARAGARVAEVKLTDDDRRALDAEMPAGTWLRDREALEPAADTDGEVVLLMGIQGAGKSHSAKRWVANEYQRLNRDLLGGRLASLAQPLERGLAAGQRRWVLDNTFARRSARARIMHAAWKHGAAVRCVHLDTLLGDAQVNAVRRILRTYGKLPEPEELNKLSRKDPHAFAPNAQFRFQRELEPPHDDEGFVAIEHVAFEREPSVHDGKAVLFQLEGVLRESRSGQRTPLSVDDVLVHPQRAPRLVELAEQGYRLCAFSWQPAVAEGRVSREQVDAIMAHTVEQLGVEVDVRYCPHGGGPPRCWCRTPLPGLAVQLVDHHELDPARCVLVGRQPADKTLATKVGFRYLTVEEMFDGAGSALV